jgi:CelD/BcsL family acetyltransferase involved in cellulose biosynthesis
MITHGEDMECGADGVLIRQTIEDLREISPEWNALARELVSPFSTVEWLTSWWEAFGQGTPTCAILRTREGALAAGAFLSAHRRRLSGTANDHSGCWTILARNGHAGSELLRQLAAGPVTRIVLPRLPSYSAALDAERTLTGSGYRVAWSAALQSPYLTLPSSFDELISRRSSNLRSQFRRRQRALNRLGSIRLRTVSDSREVAASLDSFFDIEGSGWKTARGTAILTDPKAQVLYRRFAAEAAAAGWLRLRLLEFDGDVVAGDLSVVFGGGEFLLKTGFDTELAKLSPGLVLRGEALSAAIDEGLEFYDFLGIAERYKTQWTDEIRERFSLWAFRGTLGLPSYAYRSHLRPALKRMIRRT